MFAIHLQVAVRNVYLQCSLVFLLWHLDICYNQQSFAFGNIILIAKDSCPHKFS